MPSAHVDTPDSVFQQQLHDTSTSVMQLLRSDGRQELEQDGLEQDGSVQALHAHPIAADTIMADRKPAIYRVCDCHTELCDGNR